MELFGFTKRGLKSRLLGVLASLDARAGIQISARAQSGQMQIENRSDSRAPRSTFIGAGLAPQPFVPSTLTPVYHLECFLPQPCFPNPS